MMVRLVAAAKAAAVAEMKKKKRKNYSNFEVHRPIVSYFGKCWTHNFVVTDIVDAAAAAATVFCYMYIIIKMLFVIS